MPCNSDYMEANEREVLLSRTACLLDELNGATEINRSHWNGYHPLVYNKGGIDLGDTLVNALCERLQHEDVTKRSLEMQIWWRDHLKADGERLEREISAAQEKKTVKTALGKLSLRERQLLGL